MLSNTNIEALNAKFVREWNPPTEQTFLKINAMRRSEAEGYTQSRFFNAHSDDEKEELLVRVRYAVIDWEGGVVTMEVDLRGQPKLAQRRQDVANAALTTLSEDFQGGTVLLGELQATSNGARYVVFYNRFSTEKANSVAARLLPDGYPVKGNIVLFREGEEREPFVSVLDEELTRLCNDSTRESEYRSELRRATDSFIDQRGDLGRTGPTPVSWETSAQSFVQRLRLKQQAQAEDRQRSKRTRDSEQTEDSIRRDSSIADTASHTLQDRADLEGSLGVVYIEGDPRKRRRGTLSKSGGRGHEATGAIDRETPEKDTRTKRERRKPQPPPPRRSARIRQRRTRK